MTENQDTPGAPRAAGEFRRYWTVILAAATGFSFTAVSTSSAGLFMEPLSREFGWTRTFVSSGLTISSVLTFLLSPLFGVLIDRIGTRRLALPGLVMMALVMAGLSRLSGSTLQWIVLWTLYAVAALATKSTVWTATVNSIFTAGRGLALGLVLSGSALAQAITPPLTNHLIETLGWRQAYVWLGLGWGSLALVVCALWLRDGYEAGRQARAARAEGPKAPLLDVPGLSVQEAWRDASLWRIAISTFIIMVVTIALMVHQFPILTEAGVSRSAAAYYAGLSGIAGILGKLITGVLLDRYPGRWVGGLTIGATALSFVLLLLPGASPPLIVTAMAINGYASGAKLQIVGYLTAAYCGMRNFGTIFGTMASLIAAGSGLGPVLGGLVFDRFGSYDPFLWGGIAGTLVGAIMLLGLGDYPDWARRAERGLA